MRTIKTYSMSWAKFLFDPCSRKNTYRSFDHLQKDNMSPSSRSYSICTKTPMFLYPTISTCPPSHSPQPNNSTDLSHDKVLSNKLLPQLAGEQTLPGNHLSSPGEASEPCFPSPTQQACYRWGGSRGSPESPILWYISVFLHHLLIIQVLSGQRRASGLV